MTDDSRIDARLDRLESKLDKLMELTGDIKLLQQQQAQNSQSIARAFAKIEEHDAKLDELTLKSAGAAIKLSFGERAWWLIYSAAVGVITYIFTGVKP